MYFEKKHYIIIKIMDNYYNNKKILINYKIRM